jgi:TRAP-type uncharacterized transport system substrate-binding protein
MDRSYFIASLLLSALVLGFVWELIGEAPPDKLRIVAGPRDGGYYRLAERLAARIRRHGIEVTVLETNGTLDNLNAMGEPDGPLFGLIQGGVRDPSSVDAAQLRTLATVDLEPIWILSRAGTTPVTSIEEFAARRLIGGRIGSGTRDLLERLLTEVNVRPGNAILNVSNADAAQALLNKEGDVLFSVLRWYKPGWLSELLQTGDARFVELREAPALARNFGFLAELDVPRGSLDLARGIPRSDLRLLATATNLVVHPRAHSSTKALILEELRNIDHGTAVLGTEGQFPSLAYAEWPPDRDAVQYFSQGQTFFRRYLPFWISTAVERFYALLLPLLTLLLPLSRLIPRWLARRRQRHIDTLYHKLQDIDLAVAHAAGEAVEMKIQLSRLDHFERNLSLVQRRRIAPAQFMEFCRDIDRIRRRGQATLGAPGHSMARSSEATAGLIDQGGGNREAARSPDKLLARMQSDLDVLATLKTRGDGRPMPKDFDGELDALRESLAHARRSLLHLSDNLAPSGKEQAESVCDVGTDISTEIEQIVFADRRLGEASPGSARSSTTTEREPTGSGRIS